MRVTRRGLSFDYEFLIFSVIVFTVVRLVVLYREIYIEGYNNKKFFFLTTLFALSMLILVRRHLPLNVILGWDGLGISSLFLIIFYPNNLSLFNSFLTFFFNRLGDVIIILILSTFFIFPHFNFFVLRNYDIRLIIFFAVLCALTKRAQFPASSWLPAAMSAPTPISAMVHSSTLVTAGVFLVYKFFFYIEEFGWLKIFIFFFLCRFLVGGFLANVEGDLKKIVAFSTIRQIRIILVFISRGMLSISLLHIIYHALFKTLLFCSCGLIFLRLARDQLSKLPIFTPANNNYKILFLFRIFSMSGFLFSSSFYSKDVVIETFLNSYNRFIIFSLMTGSIFTIFYCSKILFFVLASSHKISINSFFVKNSTSFFLVFFCLITGVSPWIFRILIFKPNFPVVTEFDSLILIFVLISPLFLKTNFFFGKLDYLSLEVMFFKFFSFSIFSKILLMINPSYFFNDQFLFKPFLFHSNNSLGRDPRIKVLFPIIFLISGLVGIISLYSFSLIGTWHWSCQSLRIKFFFLTLLSQNWKI